MEISGQQIKEARERKRMTQAELADELGVSMRTVGSWERGESVPRNRYGAIVDLLDISGEEPTGREYGRQAMARRLGQLAKQRREELGYGLRTFATHANIGSDRTIKDFEFGERVSGVTARRLEKALQWRAGIVDDLMRQAESRRASTVSMEDVDEFDGESRDAEGTIHTIPTAVLLEELVRRLGTLQAGLGSPVPDSQELYGMAANSDPSHLERLMEGED